MQADERKTKNKAKQQELGRRLRVARGRAGLSNRQAVEALGFAHTTLAEIEAGRRKVDVFELADLCRLYRVDLSELLRGLLEKGQDHE